MIKKLFSKVYLKRVLIGVGIAMVLSSSCLAFLYYLNFVVNFKKNFCAGQLISLGLAIRMYSQEYGEHFPDKSGAAGLEQLRAGGYCENMKMYQCPAIRRGKVEEGTQITEDITDFIYIGGLTEKEPVDTPVMMDKDANHPDGYRNVLFLNGRVGRGKGENFLEEAKHSNYSKGICVWEKYPK